MSKKVIGMIPARLGSKRVVKKNLRLINGKPLIAYCIEAALKSNAFSEIYINSESEIFGEIADYYGIKFYQRPDEFSTDTSTNDEFALDFIKNVPGDVLLQLLPTSPLITGEEIKDFADAMLREDYDSLISVEEKQIACLYNGEQINFDKLKINPPSQTMTPVQAYATVLMSWKYETFADHMERFGSAYHGGDGKTGYYPVRGLATIDIDREEDFALAEAIIASGYQSKSAPPRYYGEDKKEHSESHVASILKKDGIEKNDLEDANHEIVHLPDILAKTDPSESWSKRIINTESNCMTLLCQQPGEGNRLHYHPDWNEWWYIVEGEWEWEIEGQTKRVRAGDIVFMEKNRQHKITAAGDKRAIRMAVSRDDVAHVYPEDEQK